jgi:hypothetical protein
MKVITTLLALAVLLCIGHIIQDHHLSKLDARVVWLEGQVDEWNVWFENENLGLAGETITVRPDTTYQLIQRTMDKGETR